jgi:heat shock protein HtpX
MMRIALFLLTNIAVVAVLTIVLKILGIDVAMAQQGLQLGPLLVFSLVVGFAGSIISLLLSKTMAKLSTRAQVIDGSEGTTQHWLVETVRQLSQKAGIGMPEVAVYEGEPNAFATGAFRNSALVAVSTGLLQSMSKEEVEAVLGHEVAHVANGDMVTMTLIQGVVNAFVLYLSHIVAAIVRNTIARDDERGPSMLGVLASYLVFIAAQIVFGLLGSMITAWFSRQREFRADAGGASLAGRGAMIGALRRLQGFQGRVDNSHSPELATLKIAGGSRFLALLSTHPPLETRIRALESAV